MIFIYFRLCLHQFKYQGKKKIVGKTSSAVKPVKAMTLPARMQPPDFSKGDGVSGSGTSSVGRDGQLPDSESAKLYQVRCLLTYGLRGNIVHSVN